MLEHILLLEDLQELNHTGDECTGGSEAKTSVVIISMLEGVIDAVSPRGVLFFRSNSCKSAQRKLLLSLFNFPFLLDKGRKFIGKNEAV